jgi:O-glycosyl hydrolase
MCKVKVLPVVAVVAAGLALAGQVSAVDITVDDSVTYQTMSGFGSCLPGWISWIGRNENVQQDYWQDLGASILRIAMTPNALNADTCNETITYLGPDIDENIALFNWDINSKSAPITFGPIAQAAATMALDDYRIFGSVWSPPHYMKDGAICNNKETKGGSLIMTPENLQQLGRYMAAYVKGWSAYWSAPIDVITVQNEPGIGTKRYSSCHYSAGDLPQAVAAVRAELDANNIQCDILAIDGPWYMACWDHLADFIPYVDAQRASSLSDIDGWAYHIENWYDQRLFIDIIWNGGCDPKHGGDPCFPNGLETDGLQHMWMTESCYEANCDMGGALELAKNIYDTVGIGQCDAYLYWNLAQGGSCGNQTLTGVTSEDGCDTTVAKYCAFKHYCRYIRPGALRIGVTPAEHEYSVTDTGGRSNGLCTMAFKHPADGTLTIVLANFNGSAYTANISLDTSINVSSFDAWRTSDAGERFASVGPYAVSGGVVTVDVPAGSITTLYAGGPPDITPPAPPTNLTATAVSPSEIDLDWDDNSEPDLDGYNVYRGTKSGGPYSQVASDVSSSDYADGGLSPSTTYYYVVTAVDVADNESDDSNQASATTQDPDLTPPAAPTGLSAAAAGSSQIDLDWDDNTEPDLDSYRVYRDDTSGGPYTQIASDVPSSDYSDTGLSAATTYYYVVTAVDTSTNESSASDEASATTAEGGATMHVDSIVVTMVPVGPQRARGRAEVVIKDAGGAPVQNATVTGSFSGDIVETHSGVTNQDGLAIVESNPWTKAVSVTFCVDEVTHATLTYEPDDNVETCDSSS